MQCAGLHGVHTVRMRVCRRALQAGNREQALTAQEAQLQTQREALDDEVSALRERVMAQEKKLEEREAHVRSQVRAASLPRVLCSTTWLTYRN